MVLIYGSKYGHKKHNNNCAMLKIAYRGDRKTYNCITAFVKKYERLVYLSSFFLTVDSKKFCICLEREHIVLKLKSTVSGSSVVK